MPSGEDDKDIAAADRKLAKQYHPDENPGDNEAEDRFKEISAAYDVLGDAEKRKEYDEVREMVASGVGPGGRSGFGGPGGRPRTSASRTSATRRARRPPRRPVRRARRRAGRERAGAARSGPRPRDRAPPRLPRRGARRDDLGEHHVGGAVLGVRRFGREARHAARRLPHCAGTGAVAVDQGPFSFSQVCPTCGGRGTVVKDKCKHCKGRGVEVRPRR